MASLLFFLGFLVVLSFALYLRLPVTSVYMTSLAALAFSQRALQEPLFSILNLLRVPAMEVSSLGQGIGLRSQSAAVICLAITFVFDVLVTSVLGFRKR